MVAAGFLRLVTNVKVFPDPSPIKDALAFIDALLAVPGVEMLDVAPANGRCFGAFVWKASSLAMTYRTHGLQPRSGPRTRAS